MPIQHQTIKIEDDLLEIVPLGSGQEVGRSCCLLKFRGRTVMFDCGVHPALSGLSQLPYFDYFAQSQENQVQTGSSGLSAATTTSADDVDVVLITHFHIDHSGALPYFVNKTSFHKNTNSRIFMTHPTKSICRMLWQDHSKINRINK